MFLIRELQMESDNNLVVSTNILVAYSQYIWTTIALLQPILFSLTNRGPTISCKILVQIMASFGKVIRTEQDAPQFARFVTANI